MNEERLPLDTIKKIVGHASDKTRIVFENGSTIETSETNNGNSLRGIRSKSLWTKKEEASLTEMDIEKMENTTILQLAQQLEDGLLHSCLLNEEMSVLEFIKNYLH